MEDTSQTLTKPRNLKTAHKNRHRRRNGDEANAGEDDDDEEREEESKDEEVWDTLSKSFRQVQSVLNQNRLLIQQVTENHQSKMPDNLVKNVALIREINCNISEVMSLYSDLSINFSNIVHQRREIMASENDDDDDDKEETAGS